MTSFNLENVKHIEEETKCLVYGYIRRIEKEIAQTAPELVIYTCLLFWYSVEVFMEPTGDVLILSKDKRSFYKIKSAGLHEGWSDTMFGKDWINSEDGNVHIWDIKTIKNENDYNGIAVGFINNNHKQARKTSFFNSHSYAIFNSGQWGRINGASKSMKALRWKEGDTISLILDLKKKEIRGYMNGNKDKSILLFGDIITQKEVQYKVAISLYREGTAVSAKYRVEVPSI